MKTIKLNNEISIDLEKLVDTRLLVQANSGAGKSWAIRRILEQSHGKIQQIVIDPEGEFGTLREKFDFILAGKGGDTPATPASAALLARKLLELNVSAIIDLYELSPQDRKKFVRYFIESMVNAPKELWHPVLVIVDEAHIFVTEKGESEASGAVIDLCTRGRKRGYCAVLATQRISKLHKDAAAECNNKLIGRAGLDIDRKRASEELGFTTKEQNISLRNLEAGEFYAFGPAISNEVIKLQIGDIQTSHHKAGSRSLVEVAPPTDKIKKILGKLADLPAEAKKQAQTVEELKGEIRSLEAKLRQVPQKNVEIYLEKALEPHLIAFRSVENGYKQLVQKWADYSQRIMETVNYMTIELRTLDKMKPQMEPGVSYTGNTQKQTFKSSQTSIPRPKTVEKENLNTQKTDISSDWEIGKIEIIGVEKKFGACSKAIYSYLAQPGMPGEGLRDYSKTKVAVATGYSQNSGGFNNSISELSAAGLIERGPAGLSAVIRNYRQDLIVPIDKSLQKWSSKLGACARSIWNLMLDTNEDRVWNKEEIAQETQYSPTSGGFNNSLSELSALGLIERMPGGTVRINPEILNL